MQPGGTRYLYIPAALGYAGQAQTGIPANSDLVFAVKLVSTT
jgi:FK506-binding nuclear protein